jgi:hypothetical protein
MKQERERKAKETRDNRGFALSYLKIKIIELA